MEHRPTSSLIGYWASECGSAKIYCGDCKLVVPRINMDCVVTDPPYGMSYRSNHRAVAYDSIANDHTTEHLEFACNLAASTSFGGYVFMRWDNLLHVPKPDDFLTWVKNNHGSGDLNGSHARMTEGIAFYKGANHRFPNGRPRDVLECAITGNKLHPTEKPVDLLAEICRNTSGVICDPFMGSGTTGVAAMRLGRSFVGVEIDEGHFETAKRRLIDEEKANRFLEPMARYKQGLLYD